MFKRKFPGIVANKSKSIDIEATIVSANYSCKKLTICLITVLILGSQVVIAAEQKGVQHTPATKKVRVFATVGDSVITWKQYLNAYNHDAKNRFFHGKPEDDVLASFQREVANNLIDDILLLKEAERRKLKPDNEAVKEDLDKYDRKFARDPNWPAARKRLLPVITKNLQDENLRRQLEARVRDVRPPTTKQLRNYFDAHPDKFTSPPQPKVSVILIKVDPSSTSEEWRQAKEEAEGLVKRLRAGEDFATMAKNYSGDITAEDGGDMGYLHAGMLPGLPEQTVSKLKPGETSDPVRLLEGMAIFRLVDRIQPPPLSFEASKQRAKSLWMEEQSDLAWNALKTKLRKSAHIKMDESRFLPLNEDDAPAKSKEESSKNK